MGRKQRAMAGMGMNGFWQNRKVLITGHTGFKGAWLALWLTQMGAKVTGLGLAPETPFFDSLDLADSINHIVGDIRDPALVTQIMIQTAPDVVFHMAAQSLVLTSYETPVDTWSTNVIGTLHVLEAMRALEKPPVGVMVTTDKVYENADAGQAFCETDPLGGNDPYSASKAAMEIAVASWRNSFLRNSQIKVASARAGNVIGGGDWAENRIVPDIARALGAGRPVDVRNPHAIRPWQHVLVPLAGYLRLAQHLLTSDSAEFQSAFNFGPEEESVRSVQDLVEKAFETWPGTWATQPRRDAPHEAAVLTLTTDKARNTLGHISTWGFDASVQATLQWYKSVAEGAEPKAVTLAQISAFEAS